MGDADAADNDDDHEGFCFGDFVDAPPEAFDDNLPDGDESDGLQMFMFNGGSVTQDSPNTDGARIATGSGAALSPPIGATAGEHLYPQLIATDVDSSGGVAVADAGATDAATATARAATAAGAATTTTTTTTTGTRHRSSPLVAYSHVYLLDLETCLLYTSPSPRDRG